MEVESERKSGREQDSERARERKDCGMEERAVKRKESGQEIEGGGMGKRSRRQGNERLINNVMRGKEGKEGGRTSMG